MTAGRGISHSEQSPQARPPLLHGVQLWIALPREAQFTEPSFAHYPSLPVVEADGARVTVVAGEFAGRCSPAVVHTPLVGLEVTLPAGGSVTLATRGDFEYGVMTADGPASVAVADAPWGAAGDAPGQATTASLEPGMLAHLPAGNSAIQLSAAGPNKFFMVGGLPLGEQLIMWWNFVGRTAGEIASARDSWIAGDGRFGTVRGYAGDPLAAPPLPPGTMRPR
jgi:hypothetical protein